MNVLLCRTDKLGDLILALPSALLVKRLLPASRVSFLVQPYTAPIARLLMGLDQVLTVTSDIVVAQLASQLQAERFDAAVMLYPEFRLARALKRADIPLRAGIAYRWYSPLFTYRHPEHRQANLKHELEYNLSLVHAALGGSGSWEELFSVQNLFPLPLCVPAEIESRSELRWEQIRGAATRVIAFHPGGGGSAHRWSVNSYCELARRLTAEFKSGELLIVVTGGKDEAELCRTVAQAAGKAGKDLSGQLDLVELTAFYKRLNLLIANSTGTLHLANAVGTPVLGLFPSNPAMTPLRWGPYGQEQNTLTAPAGKTMDLLACDVVFRKILNILSV